MTKKKLIIFSAIISVVLVVSNMIGTFRLCGGRGYGNCMDIMYDIIIILSPIIPLFLFSLITCKMRDEIFQEWWRFARVWIPLSMLAILIAPSYTHNWMFPIVKGTVASLFLLIFVISSLAVIGLGYYFSKSNKQFSDTSLFAAVLLSVILSFAVFFTIAGIL